MTDYSSWDTEKLSIFLANARNQVEMNTKRASKALELIPQIEKILSERKPLIEPRARNFLHRNSSPLTTAVIEITEVIRKLQERFDLSRETAKLLSRNVSGFIPNKLLGNDGKLKTGGNKRNGQVAIDLYASYRLRHQMANITIILENDAPLADLKFIVSGENVFEIYDKVCPLAELRTLAPNTGKTTLERPAILYRNPSDAVLHFQNLIIKMDPPKR